MSIKFIANDAHDDAALVLTLPAASNTGILNAASGPRFLEMSHSGTQPFALIYRNENATLNADHLIATRADRFNGEPIDVNAYSNYSGSSTSLFSSGSFAETLVGLNSQDWVLSFTEVTSQEALEIKTTSNDVDTWGKVYFGKGVELSTLTGVEISPVSYNELIPFGRNFWHVESKLTMSFTGVSYAQISDFLKLYRLNDDAIFIYDSEETYLPGKLWHVIIPTKPITNEFNDALNVQIEAYRLREWPDYD